MGRLKSKNAIITGGASGFGAAAARRFALEGAKLVIADRDEAKGKVIVDEIKAAGGEAVFVRCDVSIEEDNARLVEAALEAFGHIDIFYCSAGISDFGTPVEYTDMEIWNRIYQVNVNGAVYAAKYIMPHFMEREQGTLLLTSSCSVYVYEGFNYAYATSKASITNLGKKLAKYYAPFNIRINIISPGTVMTGIFDEVDEDFRSMIRTTMPADRFGESEEIANAALFLVSDEASFVNGADLVVDGGQCL